MSSLASAFCKSPLYFRFQSTICLSEWKKKPSTIAVNISKPHSSPKTLLFELIRINIELSCNGISRDSGRQWGRFCWRRGFHCDSFHWIPINTVGAAIIPPYTQLANKFFRAHSSNTRKPGGFNSSTVLYCILYRMHQLQVKRVDAAELNDLSGACDILSASCHFHFDTSENYTSVRVLLNHQSWANNAWYTK